MMIFVVAFSMIILFNEYEQFSIVDGIYLL